MPEPLITTTGAATATGLTGALVLLLGPKFGPLLAPIIGDYMLILCGALAGVMHPVSTQAFTTRMQPVWYVLKWVLTAVALAGGAAALIERYIGFPASNWPGVVAFVLTFLADRWRPLVDFGMERVKLWAEGGAR